MSGKNPLLSAVLLASGAACCLLYLLSIVWPSGWAWHEGSPASNNYFMMIVGLYATLGIFLIRAARDPLANASLIWFTIWSSIVHAGVMAWQSVAQPMHKGHLVGDVPALLFIAGVLAFLMRRAQKAGTSAAA
jgi:hypothetical protein